VTPRDAHQAGRRHTAQGRERSRAPAGARSYRSESVALGDGARSIAGATAASRSSSPVKLRLVRYGLPGMIVGAGVIAICFATPTALIGGSGLVGAGLATALVSWFYRLGVEGDTVRDEEDWARRYFDRYGRWPDGRA
jgi:hypothetical protein